MIRQRIISIFVFLLLSQFSFSQLIEVGLEENSEIKKYIQDNPVKYKAKGVRASKELPFFDDFSYESLYPTDTLWEDSNVFINNHYAHMPPSIGVATFDALNKYGELHDNSSTNQFAADTLTSVAINLNFLTSGDSIYFSFYYQPQGLGNAPDVKDSLVLEFYSTIGDKWNRIWSDSGSVNRDFERVMILIDDVNYLSDGFKFRFYNYASLSQIIPSKRSNVDQWNIDYLYLNKDRSYNDDYADIAMVEPLESLIKTYRSVPWKHYIDTLMVSSEKISVRNFLSTENFAEYFFTIKDVLSGSEIYNSGSLTVFDFETGIRELDININYQYVATSEDSAIFEITSVVDPDNQDVEINNSATYIQEFKNYYAYDDGTAEGGVGLYGESTKNGMMAYKFENLKEDTLRAVQMYFNKAKNSANQKYFYLCIWDEEVDDPENLGKPRDTIYSQVGDKPEFDGLNVFHTYELDEPYLLPKGTFFIGWIKTTEDMLNVGFDKSVNVQQNIYYNIEGSWVESPFLGAMMVRPVFGKELNKDGKIDKPKIDDSSFDNIVIYPNPIGNSNGLIIQSDKNNITSLVTVTIYNVYGTVFYSGKSNKESINVNFLKNGVYFIKIESEELSLTRKFIKTN